MSYLYDELKQIAKETGKTIKQISVELNIKYNTVQKWSNREPHPKYKEKVIQYIKSEREKLTKSLQQMFQEPEKAEDKKDEEIFLESDEHGIPVGFWDKLREIYLSHTNGENNWGNEKDKLKEVIIGIAEVLATHKYKIISPIDYGGTAVILRIRDESLGVLRALKVARPIERHQDLFAEIMTTEIGYLLEASHKNIVEIYFRDEIVTDFGKFPFYVMKFIKGAQSAQKYFKEKRNAQELINIVKQIVTAINHLHSMSIIHFDIKPNNILVSEDGDALLSDLGSARKHENTDEEVPIVYTKQYAHPKLTAIKWYSTSDSDRNRGYIKRKEIDTCFDIYAFGKTLLELVNSFDPNIVTERILPYERKYLLLMACRALDGENSDSEIALGLPKDAFKELKYQSFHEILDDIDKLTGEFPLDKKLPELNPYIVDVVQSGSNWKTPLTKRLINLLAHPTLQRLTGVSQLGLLTQIYPTATHTRLQHSLGSFANTIKIIEALYNDPINPLFKQIMTVEDLQCLLLVALFHDIGHFPLAHDLHEAFPSIFNHDSIGIKILEGEKDWFSGSTLRAMVLRDWNIDTKQVAGVLKADPTDTSQPIKNRILHTIISGPIDADKLDYLIRDARTLNIPYASVIDLDRLISCLTVIFMQQGAHTYAALGIHEKGKFSAEGVSFARYAMFGSVYWHHTFRAVKSMLHRAVWECRKHKYSGPNGDRELENAFCSRFFESTISKTMWEEDELETLTQVLPSDREVLNWFYKNTTDKGKQLIKQINHRTLFKRICVISAYRPSVWQQLINFRKNATYSQMVSLEDKIQEEIVEYIRNLTDSDRERNSILTVDRTEQVIAMHSKGSILFLIDIPTERIIGNSRLRYLPESARHDLLENWSDPVELEDSTFWTHLHSNFLSYIGKVRLFCHPDIADVVSAAINRDNIEKIIDGALRYIAK